MVFRTESTYSESEKILEKKYDNSSNIGYTLLPGVYEISDITLMLKSLIPNQVKANIAIDPIRLRSDLTNNKNNQVY